MLARIVLAFAAVTLATAADPMGRAGLPALRSARAGAPFRSYLRSNDDGDNDTYNDPDCCTGGKGRSFLRSKGDGDEPTYTDPDCCTGGKGRQGDMAGRACFTRSGGEGDDDTYDDPDCCTGGQNQHASK